MSEQSKPVEWESVNDALLDAICGIDIEWQDDRFSYEYGSITGTHGGVGAVLAQDTIEIDARVPYASGWMFGDDENGVMHATREVDGCEGIRVTVEPLSLNVRLENGFWLVRGIFNVEEVER